MRDDTPDVEASGVGESLRLLLWLLAVGVLPVWVLLTVTLAQVHPDLQSVALTDAEQTEVLGYLDGSTRELAADPEARMERYTSTREKLFAAGLMAGAWLLAAAAIIGPSAWLVGALWRRRREAENRRLHPPDLLGDDLVAGAAWQVELRSDAPPSPEEVPEAVPEVAETPQPEPRPVERDAPAEPSDVEDDFDRLFDGR